MKRSLIQKIFGDSPTHSFRTWPLLLGLLAVMAACIAMEVVFHLYRHDLFGEGGLVTRLSVLQLAATSVFLARTYALRRRNFERRSWKDPWFFWLLCSAAFAYLAMDEKMLLHEGIGHLIRDHIWTGGGSFSSRADDWVVGVYGIFAIILAWRYRREIFRAPRAILFGVGGFCGLASTVIFDVLSHRDDFMSMLISDPELLDRVMQILARSEETTKLLGEAFFLAAAHAVLRRVMEDFPVDDPALNRNTRRWQTGLLIGLLALATALTLEQFSLFQKVWFLNLVPLAVFALLTARAMGFRRNA